MTSREDSFRSFWVGRSCPISAARDENTERHTTCYRIRMMEPEVKIRKRSDFSLDFFPCFDRGVAFWESILQSNHNIEQWRSSTAKGFGGIQAVCDLTRSWITDCLLLQSSLSRNWSRVGNLPVKFERIQGREARQSYRSSVLERETRRTFVVYNLI